jgi:hypothetical protein
MMNAQMKSFMDGTGGLWGSGALVGKPAGCFVSVGTQGGGMETTALTFVTQCVHHGMVFVVRGLSRHLLFPRGPRCAPSRVSGERVLERDRASTVFRGSHGCCQTSSCRVPLIPYAVSAVAASCDAKPPSRQPCT